MELRKSQAEVYRLKAETLSEEVRPEVLRLASWMEIKLREKEPEPGWKASGGDPHWFVGQAYDELQELTGALYRLTLEDSSEERYFACGEKPRTSPTLR